MSRASNDNGRAYEYACVIALHEAVKQHRTIQIVQNSSLEVSKSAWDKMSKQQQELYQLSAASVTSTIFAMEPNILEVSSDTLDIYIQSDQEGQEADVRDIILRRNDIVWEIGLSVKHNHLAIKHSRIARSLDFGKKWYGVPCSSMYWEEVKSVFDFLESEKKQGTLFSELENKDLQIYLPLLNAFVKEIERQVRGNTDIAQRFVGYLLSRYDFYKIISHDEHRITTIQSFNMYGTLNLPSKKGKPIVKVQRVNLPQNMLYIGLKSGSMSTVLLSFDNGWQFSFRIHNNANKIVEPSLKFDICIEGIPAELNIKYHCKW